MTIPQNLQLPRLMGHRGAPAVAPENRIVSIAAAKDGGVDWVELDVLHTADGVAVIHHDQTMARCFDDPRRVTQARADSLPAGLPTLGAMLDALGARDMGVNLELKTYDDSDVDRLVAAVLAQWHRKTPVGFFSSFEPSALARVRADAPMVPRAFITETFTDDDMAQALALGCFAINVDHNAVTTDAVASAHAAGLQVGTWTVNSVADATRCWQAGVACVITDDPALLAANANDL